MQDKCPHHEASSDRATGRGYGLQLPPPVQLFDALSLHPSIVEVSRSLFAGSHYAQAIFEAYKCLVNEVKRVSGLLGIDGKELMARAFNENGPAIRLNPMATVSDRDEQEGFRFIFMGAVLGIRNPKAHDLIVQNDPYKTLEYLGLASLLLRRIDERE